MGYLRPPDKPSWWNENQWLYAVMPGPASGWGQLMLTGTSLTPFTGTNIVTISKHTSLQSANLQTGERDLIAGVAMVHTQGYVGRMPDDFVGGALSGVNPFDTIVVSSGTEEYQALENSSGGIAIRTV